LIVPLQLPEETSILALGRGGEMVWDSTIDRTQQGDLIEARFVRTMTSYDRPW
jgi:hypothetical protein